MMWKRTRAWLAAVALAVSGGSLQAQFATSNFAEGPVPGSPVAEQQRQFNSPLTAPERLFPEFGGIQIFGWLNGGYIYNTTAPGANFNGPYNAVDLTWPMGNQAYVVVEKGLKGDDFDIGGRFDFLYGEDFLLAQSRGFELNRNGTLKWNNQWYGFAMPQIYLEAGNETASVKVGHFYSIVGYEGVPAPNNFFYSKSYSYMFAGPFTFWGALGAWKVNDNLTVQGGVVNGWNALDRVTNSVNGIAGAKWTDELFWTSFAIVAGSGSPDAAAFRPENTNGNELRYSFLLGLTPVDGVEYVFHQWYGTADNYTPVGGQARWYGVDQYLYAAVTEQVKAGMRFEWFRDEQGTRVGLNRPANPNKPGFQGNFFSATAGVNYDPNANLRIRPEVRWDWYDGQAGRLPYGTNGNKANQLMIGCDFILQF
jgi:hypothetical protein